MSSDSSHVHRMASPNLLWKFKLTNNIIIYYADLHILKRLGRGMSRQCLLRCTSIYAMSWTVQTSRPGTIIAVDFSSLGTFSFAKKVSKYTWQQATPRLIGGGVCFFFSSLHINNIIVKYSKWAAKHSIIHAYPVPSQTLWWTIQVLT